MLIQSIKVSKKIETKDNEEHKSYKSENPGNPNTRSRKRDQRILTTRKAETASLGKRNLKAQMGNIMYYNCL